MFDSVEFHPAASGASRLERLLGACDDEEQLQVAQADRRAGPWLDGVMSSRLIGLSDYLYTALHVTCCHGGER